MAKYSLLQMINIVKHKLGEDVLATLASTTDRLALYLMDEINLLMYEIAGAADWRWLYRRGNSFATVVNQQDYSAAGGELNSDAEYYFNFRQQKTPLLLKRRDEIWLAHIYPDYTDSEGDPENVIVPAYQTIWLDPIPTSVMTIYYDDKKYITRLTADGNTPDIPEKDQHILLTGLIWKGMEFIAKSVTPLSTKEESKFYAKLQKMIDLHSDPLPDHYPKMAGWDYGENPYA